MTLACSLGATPKIDLVDCTFVVDNLDGSDFAVYVAGLRDVPPLAGNESIEGQRLRFQPKYALQPGTSYRAVYGSAERVFKIPREEPTQRTSLERIYPSTNRLPENLLKLYFHFSAPMSRGEAYRRISLMNQDEGRVELPFLEVDQELWDQDNMRLTVFLDPGRVKRGLIPNMEEGPPLVAGREFSLVLDRNWRDANGDTLEREVVKRFFMVEADYESPAVETWMIEPPSSGSRKALQVAFPEPLDHALLNRLIRVMTISRRPVAGRVQVDRDETRWLSEPTQRWIAGEYLLQVESVIEDLAGNSTGRPFEVDPSVEQSRPETAEVQYRKFVVR